MELKVRSPWNLFLKQVLRAAIPDTAAGGSWTHLMLASP
jgi:hypothetical protein